MDSLPEDQAKQNLCHSCGVYWEPLFFIGPGPEPMLVLCAECKQRFFDEGQLHRRFRPEFGPPLGAAPERFGALLKAARVLLRERVADEDQIVPTLWGAYEIDRGSQQWVAIKERVVRGDLGRLRRSRKEGAVRQIEGPANLRAVRVVDGVPVLECEPVFAEIVVLGESLKPLSSRWKRHLSSEAVVIPHDSDLASFGSVLIRVYPHKRQIKPDKVSFCYEEALATEGIACDGAQHALLEYELLGYCLYLSVTPGKEGVLPSQRGGFPPPRLVGNFYEALSREFRGRLARRQAGGEMDADTLIPACVAFLLRVSGGVERRAEIERLLNEHVFDRTEKYLPGSSVPQNVQLWRDVQKAQKQIVCVLARM